MANDITARYVLDFEYKLPSKANARGHTREWATVVARHRNDIALVWLSQGGPRVLPPCKLTFIRVAPRKLDVGNLAMAFKAIQDGLCHCLNIRDDPYGGVEFDYDQWSPSEACKPTGYEGCIILMRQYTETQPDTVDLEGNCPKCHEPLGDNGDCDLCTYVALARLA